MSLFAGGVLGLHRARSEFRRAHAAGRLRGAVARLMRRCARVCTLSETAPGSGTDAGRGRTGTLVRGPRRLTEVPLDRVIGSVQRAGDYAPGFLPLVSHDEERWAGVYLALEGQQGLPPVELVELDGDYYVEDGHHRVSVMKRMGARSVEAYVTPLRAV